jgi:NADH-quinone oxidoreductase subunit N
MFLLCGSFDFITIFVAIELQSLAFYSLVVVYSYSEFSIESGVKYYVLGSISSCFLLFGLSLIYFEYGSLHLNSIALLAQNSFSLNLLPVGTLMVVLSFLFKLGVVPFHY